MNVQNDNKYFAHYNLSGLSYGTVVSKQGTGIDCRMMESVTGINSDATLPAGTNAYFAFSVNYSDWFKLSSSGTAVIISSGVPDFYTLRDNGNIPPDFRSLSNIPAFAKNLVAVAVGVSSADINNAKPSVKLSVTGGVTNQTASCTEYSPIYNLGDNATITELSVNPELTSGANLTVTAKITDPEDIESDWLLPSQTVGLHAKSVQLKCIYQSPNIGVSSARLLSANIGYSRNATGAPMTDGRIYSVTEDWHMNIKSARISVRHSPLDEATLNVYAAFRKSPGHVVNHMLGISPAGRKTYELPQKNGINFDSFKLYADNQLLSSGYELNSQAGRVTLTAPEGSFITVSYSYGWDLEQWRPLTLAKRESFDDFDLSEFTLTVPENDYSVSSFMIESACSSGNAYNELLGTASGVIQTFSLKHRAVNLNSVTYGSSTTPENPVDRKNYVLLGNSKLLRIAAPSGKYIRASYSWQSLPVQIFQVTAVYYD